MLLLMNEEGKGASHSVREEHAQRPMKQEDVEGRGREREEGRNVDGVGSVTAGARLGRAAEVAARSPGARVTNAARSNCLFYAWR